MIDDRVLAILIFAMLAMLVAVKQVATGRILDRPEGSPLVQLVNVFNLLFLLVVNPVAGVLLLPAAWRRSIRATWLCTSRG